MTLRSLLSAIHPRLELPGHTNLKSSLKEKSKSVDDPGFQNASVVELAADRTASP